MDDLRFLSTTSSRDRELSVRAFATEAELSQFVVRHAQAIAGVTIIALKRRITSNGVDAENCPVIIEFKKDASGGAICQGLYYLDWLVAHREVFTLIALKKIGPTRVEGMRWSRARLMCIAQEISEREAAVARQVGAKVELLRIQRLSSNLIAVQRATSVSDRTLQR